MRGWRSERREILTNKANLGASKSAASVAAGATCRAAGGRRLQKTNPFGEAWRTERPEDRETGGPGDRGPDGLPVAWCLFRSRGLSGVALAKPDSRRKRGNALCHKDLQISGRSRNFPFRSGTFRFVPFRSAECRVRSAECGEKRGTGHQALGTGHQWSIVNCQWSIGLAVFASPYRPRTYGFRGPRGTFRFVP